MAAEKKVAFPRRGDIYLVSFDPAFGSEIRKTRPALVIQNDLGNRFSDTTIVAAVTSRTESRLYPTEVAVIPPEGGLSKPSVVLLDQVRTMDKRRLQRRLGRLAPATMERVNDATRISLGLPD